MFSHWILRNIRFSPVSRSLRVLIDLNNAVIWMVSTRPLISKFSNPCANPLVTVACVPFTTGIIVTFMFHSFFFVLYEVSVLFSLFALPNVLPERPSLLGSVFSKSQRGLGVSFSRTDSGLGICHSFITSNLNFLHNSLWIPFPTQWSLVLNSFCTNLLHSVIIWLIVSSLSPHNLHLLFSCVLSIFALI